MKINGLTIRTNDLEKSKVFYRDYLGMVIESEFSPFEGTHIVILTAENAMSIELLFNVRANIKADNSGVSFGMHSSKYEQLLQTAREENIVTDGPRILGGRFECFFITDPNGVGIQVTREISEKM
ncbi:MAG: glyoxalase family protein [Herbinix sp.]|jgi:catechol 2,3-dioxygenase-like lactoylglutathione lyase family enzyme|nr:glyoxalase family protein [Herbinix sp.]